jgi:hypothetical protein
MNQLTDEQEEYLRKVMIKNEEGALSRGIAKKIWDQINVKEVGLDAQKVYFTIKKNLSDSWLKDTYNQSNKSSDKKREVILSQMLFPN